VVTDKNPIAWRVCVPLCYLVQTVATLHCLLTILLASRLRPGTVLRTQHLAVGLLLSSCLALLGLILAQLALFNHLAWYSPKHGTEHLDIELALPFVDNSRLQHVLEPAVIALRAVLYFLDVALFSHFLGRQHPQLVGRRPRPDTASQRREDVLVARASLLLKQYRRAKMHPSTDSLESTGQ
jgi:hypothetical protein